MFLVIFIKDKYKGSRDFNPYLMFPITDETYALVIAIKPPDGVDRAIFYAVLSFLDHCYWVLGSTLGAFFLFFSKRKPPEILDFIKDSIPPAVMTVSVLYCFKDIDWATVPHGLPELLAVLFVPEAMYSRDFSTSYNCNRIGSSR